MLTTYIPTYYERKTETYLYYKLTNESKGSGELITICVGHMTESISLKKSQKPSIGNIKYLYLDTTKYKNGSTHLYLV